MAPPVFVLWGGPRDSCVLVNFEEASLKLEDELVDGMKASLSRIKAAAERR